jgi:hypothetical protein
MNTDTNLAAWMIARGHIAPDPADARNLAHRIALASRADDARPSIAARIGAAFAWLRTPRAPAEPACCSA